MTQFVYSTMEVNGRHIAVLSEAPPPAEAVDYSGLAKAALIELAEDRSLDVSSRMNKAAIIALLEGND